MKISVQNNNHERNAPYSKLADKSATTVCIYSQMTVCRKKVCAHKSERDKTKKKTFL